MATDLNSISQKIEELQNKLKDIYQQTGKPLISAEQNRKLQQDYNRLNQQLHHLVDFRQSLILSRANNYRG